MSKSQISTTNTLSYILKNTDNISFRNFIKHMVCKISPASITASQSVAPSF
ncbi:hypothetical protein Hanom_Chr03g00271031 [Helianthus anomalus]